jgi:8-oxo-dGTP pyrophosphatase MutT (NUDIX family)
MPWSPAVTVAAVIRQHDRFLMVEESPDGRRVLNQPAGHLEADETLVEAVRREVLEETGRRFTPTGLIGVYQWTVPQTGTTYLRFCFAGTAGEPLPGQPVDPDIHATHWLTTAQIADGRLPARSPLVLRCLRDSQAHDPLPLYCLHALR